MVVTEEGNVKEDKSPWPGWAWIERLVWIVVLVVVVRRLGPQVRSVMSAGGDLGHMPPFAVETLGGDSLKAEDLLGKVVLVNFWATWCAPCRVEMPGFDRVYQDYQAEGFAILGFATDREGRAPVEAFLTEHNISYPVALAPPGLSQAFGGLQGLPTSFLIDRGGVVRHRVFGFYAPPALRLAVRRALAEE